MRHREREGWHTGRAEELSLSVLSKGQATGLPARSHKPHGPFPHAPRPLQRACPGDGRAWGICARVKHCVDVSLNLQREGHRFQFGERRPWPMWVSRSAGSLWWPQQAPAGLGNQEGRCVPSLLGTPCLFVFQCEVSFSRPQPTPSRLREQGRRPKTQKQIPRTRATLPICLSRCVHFFFLVLHFTFRTSSRLVQLMARLRPWLLLQGTAS